MSEFVEECRREWRRLSVPDAIANEMAADLEADLKEAEAEGASAEEVLGSGAFDPRAFAAAWAAERGVGQQPVGPQPSGFPPSGSQPAAFQPPLFQPPAFQPPVFQPPVFQPPLFQPTGAEAPGLQPPLTKGGNAPARFRLLAAVIAFGSILLIGLAIASGRSGSASVAALHQQFVLPGGNFPANGFSAHLHLISVVPDGLALLLLLIGAGGLIVSVLYWSRWTRSGSWPQRRPGNTSAGGGFE